MSHNWTEEQTLLLIDLVRGFPNIWNPENETYKNRNKRTDAFKNIAEALGLSREECERKWKVVQHQFRRECVKSVTKSGQGKSELYVSHWFGYKHLMFLKDKNKPRHTRDTEVEAQELENTQEDDTLQSKIFPREDSSDTHAEPSRETVTKVLPPRQETSAYSELYESEPSLDTVGKLVPPGKKTSEKRSCPSDPQIDEAFTAIKTLTGNRSKRDSFDVYGEHVANKLRTYKAFIRADVEHKINCLLHDADMQMLYQSQEQWNQRPTYLPPVSVSSASSSYPSPFPSPHPSESLRHSVEPQEDGLIDALLASQNQQGDNYLYRIVIKTMLST